MTSFKFPQINSYPGLLSSSDWLDQNTYGLELTYVTESVIVLTCSDYDRPEAYDHCLKDLVHMLNMKHADNYMVINLSQRRYGLSPRGGCRRVLDQGWPTGHAPTLEQLCSICRSMDEWLSGSNALVNGSAATLTAGGQRVVALHSEGGLDSVALVVAAYINYCSAAARPEQALDRMAMKQFFDEQLGGLLGPSQVRYVRYFSSLLTGQLQLSNEPVFLQHVVLHGVPCFDTRSTLRPFVKIYQNMRQLYVSRVYSVLPMQQRVCFSMTSPLELLGDIMLKCYHKAAAGTREVVFRLQFNTSTVPDARLVASKTELDGAVNDQRFPDNGRVELIFTANPEAGQIDRVDVSLSQDAPHDPIVHWDSYENLDAGDLPAADAEPSQPAVVKRGIRVSRYFEEGPLEDSIFSNITRNGQMSNDLFTGFGSATGSGFGVTNVSSHGNVDITIIPPSPTAKTALREQLSPTNKGFLARSAPTASGSSGPSQNSVPGATPGLAGTSGTVKVEKSFSLPAAAGVTGTVRSAATPFPPLAAVLAPGASSATSKTSYYSSSTSHVNGYSSAPVADTTRTPAITGAEQNDLDKILNELLGDTSSPSVKGSSVAGAESAYDKERRQFVNADGSTTTIERRLYKAPHVTENLSIQKTAYRSTSPAPPSVSQVCETGYRPAATAVDGSGTSWLEQQQQKLRHRSNSQQGGTFDSETTSPDSRTQARQPLVVSEVRIDKAKSGSAAGGQSFTAQREVLVQQQPVAYTVMITPKDQVQPVREPQQLASNKKTVTNVNKTVSAHYNFHGSADGQVDDPEIRKQMEEQQKRIAELEEKLRTLDRKLLDQAASAKAPPVTQLPPPVQADMIATDARPPPRPPRAAAAAAAPGHEEEDEVLAFRPVGIQNLESTSGISPSTLPRSAAGSGTAPLTPTYFPDEEGSMAFVPVGMAALDSNTRSFGTTRSQAAHSSGFNNTGTVRRDFASGAAHSGSAVNGYSQQQQAPIRYTDNVGSPQGYTQTMESRSVHQSYRQQASGGSSGGGYNDVSPVLPTGPLPLSAGSSANYAPFSTGTLGSNYGQQQQSYQRQEFAQNSGGQSQGWGTAGGAYSTLPPQPPPSARGFDGYGTNTLQQQHSQYKYSTLSNQSQSGYNQQFGDAAVDGWQTAGSTTGGGYATLQSNAAGRGQYGTGSRRGSIGSVASENFFATNSEQMQMAAKYVKDMSKFWYKPNITRDEAITMLKDAPPGTFVVRDSNSFPGAFGLAVKVAQLPSNVTIKSGTDALSEYVRFFLIEPTAKGVRLKGCANEPTFGSLASLIYQHTVTPLALPVKLLLPDPDKLKHSVSFNLVETDHVDGLQHGVSGLEVTAAAAEQSELLRRGVACNVVYLNTVDTEMLSGPQAISRAVQQTFAGSRLNSAVVNFKVSSDGITITDGSRKLFLRQHFSRESVIYCGLDPADRRFTQPLENGVTVREAKIFGFVTKKNGNQCVLFAEADADQPATAIVNFITRFMMTSK